MNISNRLVDLVRKLALGMERVNPFITGYHKGSIHHLVVIPEQIYHNKPMVKGNGK